MPEQTQQAIIWALQQSYINDLGEQIQVTQDNALQLVDHVREYFNANNIVYNSFAYEDLIPYI